MDTNREELILKWLDGSLTEAEQQAFENLEDHQELMRISTTAKQFKAPSFNSDIEYKKLRQKLTNQSKARPLWQPLLAIASIVVVALAVYMNVFFDPLTTVETGFGQTQHIDLPNGSMVAINADSKLTYHSKKWGKERKLNLEGEAYFNVTKGNTFRVETTQGTVTVLGTEFNIIQRGDWFEVTCFEGLVQVATSKDTVKLPPQHSFKVLDGVVTKDTQFSKTADWLENQSRFSGMPYAYVIDELKRQYNVTIISKGIDITKVFTGAFTHDNLELALTTISQPMNLSFTIDGDQITLSPID